MLGAGAVLARYEPAGPLHTEAVLRLILGFPVSEKIDQCGDREEEIFDVASEIRGTYRLAERVD